MTLTLLIPLILLLLAGLYGLGVLARRDYRRWIQRKSRMRSRWEHQSRVPGERPRQTTVIRSS